MPFAWKFIFTFMLSLAAFQPASADQSVELSPGDMVSIVRDTIVSRSEEIEPNQLPLRKGEQCSVIRVDPDAQVVLCSFGDQPNQQLEGWIPIHDTKLIIKDATSGKLIASRVLVVTIHVLVIGTIIAMLLTLIAVINEPMDNLEIAVRAMGLAGGLLVYAVVRAMGMSIPESITTLLAPPTPLRTLFIGIVFPAGVGAGAAYAFKTILGWAHQKAIRFTILVATLVTALFADLYAHVFSEINNMEFSFAYPNTMFALGMIVFLMMTVNSTASSDE
ncbi:MAG: hypothetical protein KDB03_17480 [Planctomycetales bacterium]|nr:hypothetical protein [Planctomycetales bacterium]